MALNLQSLGTGLGGFMQGYGQQQDQRARFQALQAALAQQRKQQQAKALAYQGLLGGALGGTGGAPLGNFPMPQAAPVPPMPGQSSAPPPAPPAPSPAAGGIPDPRGPMGVLPQMPATGGGGIPDPRGPLSIQPGNEAPTGPVDVRTPTDADMAPADDIGVSAIESAPLASPSSAAGAAPAGGTERAPAAAVGGGAVGPQAPTNQIDLTQFFHQVDPSIIAQRIQQMKPGVDPETAMLAVEELYKLSTQGSKVEQAQVGALLKMAGFNVTMRGQDIHAATAEAGREAAGARQDKSIEAAAGRQEKGIAAAGTRQDKGIEAAGRRQDKRIEAADRRMLKRLDWLMAKAATSPSPQFKAQVSALNAKIRGLLNRMNVGSPTPADKAALDQASAELVQMWTKEGEKPSGMAPAPVPGAPIIPPQ